LRRKSSVYASASWGILALEKEIAAVNKEKPESESQNKKIDRTAPAGSENSLGAESIRDGRPDTDDSVVEAIDEEGPGIE
jgi:hypothetical protein